MCLEQCALIAAALEVVADRQTKVDLQEMLSDYEIELGLDQCQESRFRGGISMLSGANRAERLR